MPPNLTRILVWTAVGIYFFYRLYARLRRMVGRQKFKKKFLMLLTGFYIVASLALAVFTRGRLQLVLGWLVGLVPGVILGVWALRLTRFETPEEGDGYTPNAHIGMALYLIFLGRLLYRGIAFYTHFSLTGRPPPPAGQSALTDLIFELLAGYYIAYYVGILRHYERKSKLAASAA